MRPTSSSEAASFPITLNPIFMPGSGAISGAHNFGIAKALAIDETAGAFAILGMTFNALMTTLILIAVSRFGVA
jgi:putative effector of murein hydrolase